MRARRGIVVLLAIVALGQASCAEIPTAPLTELTLRGSVMTPDGGPVIGADVLFRRTSHGEETEFLARTGGDGSYRLQVTAGTYLVDIFAPDGVGLPDVHVGEVKVAGNSPRYDYRYGGLEVLGTVTGPSGAPVINARVTLSGKTAGADEYVSVTTQFDGTTFRAFLPPGLYGAYVSSPSPVDGIPERVFRSLALNTDTTLAFSLSGHRVHGQVVGPDGLPMSGVSVYLEGSDAVSGVNSSADGSYELYAPTGLYRRWAFPGLDDRHVMEREFGYVAVSGDLPWDLDFSGTWWSGTVLDAPGGNAVPNAYVVVYSLATFGYAVSECDANGAFRVSVVKGAWHRARVYAPDREDSVSDPLLAGADSTLALYTGAPTPQGPTPPPPVVGAPVFRIPTPSPRAGRAGAG